MSENKNTQPESDMDDSNLSEEEYRGGAESAQTPAHAGSDSSTPDSADKIKPEEMQQLVDELDGLIYKLHSIYPEYEPPSTSSQEFVSFVREYMAQLSPSQRLGFLESLREFINEDLLDIDTWKGFWYMLYYSADYQLDFVKKRMRGEFETDEWGLDEDVVSAVRPFFEFLFSKYWRVETSGLENIPAEGRALLVGNHSGQIPWDGTMIGTAILENHPTKRFVRGLYASWFTTLPFISPFLVKLGQTLANEENGIRLLEQEQLVLVFPEGLKGISKLYKDRYRLARFGRGGFVRMALKTGAPIIPVSVVGAEETYITIKKTPLISKLLGYPVPPISLRWPWLGPLGLVPLPTKWFIDFGQPISMSEYGTGGDENLVLVSQLTDQVRNTIQKMVYARLAERDSIFFG